MARSSSFISISLFCTGLRVKVEGITSAVLSGAGMALLAMKKGYCSDCDTVGRCCGSYSIKSCMSATPSAEAFGMSCDSGVGTNCGNRNCICAANLRKRK